MAAVLVSIAIVVILGLQTAASFGAVSRLTGRTSHWLWPFLDYPMYRWAHYAGEAVHREAVFATLEDGTEAPFRPDDLGINFWQFHDGVVAALRRADAAALAPYADLFRSRQGRHPTHLRLETSPLVLTRDGLVPAPKQVLGVVALGPEPDAAR